jgi:hypothetical protein
LREATVGFFDAIADQMVSSIYPMWSQVLDNAEFEKMIETPSGSSASAK